MAVGLAQGAFEYAFKYVQERSVFGQRLSDLQGPQFILSDMATEIEAARQARTREAARRADAGEPFSHSPRWPNITPRTWRCASRRMRSTRLGGHGYTAEHPVERMMRDAKAIEIFEGANELQRALVFRQLVKEILQMRGCNRQPLQSFLKPASQLRSHAFGTRRHTMTANNNNKTEKFVVDFHVHLFAAGHLPGDGLTSWPGTLPQAGTTDATVKHLLTGWRRGFSIRTRPF